MTDRGLVFGLAILAALTAVILWQFGHWSSQGQVYECNVGQTVCERVTPVASSLP